MTILQEKPLPHVADRPESVTPVTSQYSGKSDPTNYVAEIADAMQMLEPASLQPVKPSKYILMMVTVIENREQLQYFLSQNVTLHVSTIDGKVRAFTKVRE